MSSQVFFRDLLKRFYDMAIETPGQILTIISNCARNPLDCIIPLLSLLWVWNWRQLKRPGFDRNFRLEILQDDAVAQTYRKAIRTLLTSTARQIGDEENLRPTRTNNVLVRNVRHAFNGTNPWTLPSYAFCLSLSFIYPVFSFLIDWVLHSSITLAGYVFLPSSQIQSEYLKLSLSGVSI